MKKCMKKIIAGLLSALLICLGVNSYSYAAVNIAESANVKVFVGGQRVRFSSNPIAVNGQILLNGKELLVKLGIPNDNKHIQLDKNQKNLIINTGKKQIKMTVDSTRAAVGKSSGVLNAAPVLYKNIYYIPAKSTAQLLDMKYAWDAEQKSVYIQKSSDYNRVKAVLDKAVAASKAAGRYEVEYSKESISDYGDYPVTGKASTVSKVDKEKMIMTIKGNGRDSANGSDTGISEYYLYNNYIYSKNFFKDRWEKKLISEQEYRYWILNYDAGSFEISDILYCGLTIQENKKDNTILLKGNAFLHANKEDYEFEPVDTYLEISINKNNHLINRITLTHSEYLDSDYFGRYLYSSSETYEYRNYNGNFAVETPDESQMEVEGEQQALNALY
ncbi:copper amine oxidase N-terminal domain-containing protein [Ruminiclostridium cellobioparum]|uniref:Copper amine oxidase family protein n=1 Tax=Ruminiclostridium cellobioparum subsp. termitidis CT1112 TaxID=1195236 RepID=S0FX05_RUMCE|nr:copper amine oxidase N-terminal domain-containing protein [Ruminiclostridium cellobioparum]EMS73689.1 copper amine oxidase family protein [Ruminiclostridium cellobioparum subsp. termitidis CT1112]